MSPAFYELHTQIKTQRPHTVVCKGGRGSTKSSFMSVEFILFLLQHPQCHGVVLRKIANTLRNSVYAQIQWAIGALGLQNKFHHAEPRNNARHHRPGRENPPELPG